MTPAGQKRTNIIIYFSYVATFRRKLFPVFPNMKTGTKDSTETLVSYAPNIVVTLEQEVFVAVQPGASCNVKTVSTNSHQYTVSSDSSFGQTVYIPIAPNPL